MFQKIWNIQFFDISLSYQQRTNNNLKTTKKFKIMKIVKIKKEYCENIEESKLNFEIVEDNGNRLLIRAINTGLSIPPITLVKKEWLIF